ncbi:hypothetical protein BH23GEM11_BH23GEM11_19030 [soil metagenome]
MRAAGGGWLALHLPVLGALSACAREASLNGEPLRYFTPTEARTFEAMAERLIPSLDGIGAREAGAVHFVDLALTGFFREDAAFLRGGLTELVDMDFADLDPEAQVRHLESIEDTPFFGFALALTVFGTFSDPKHGGGRGDATHRIYGIEHRPAWESPFGWYDAEVTS